MINQNELDHVVGVGTVFFDVAYSETGSTQLHRYSANGAETETSAVLVHAEKSSLEYENYLVRIVYVVGFVNFQAYPKHGYCYPLPKLSSDDKATVVHHDFPVDLKRTSLLPPN